MKKIQDSKFAKDRAATRALLPLVALGGGLTATPSMALELGELTVQSGLGQPLRASIAYALAPNEMLSNTCVAVGGGQSTGGLPGIGRHSISITDSAILVRGESLVREPMLGTRVTVNCPYTPNLSREYMLFVDPVAVPDAQAGTATTVKATTVKATAAASVTATPALKAPRSATTAPVNKAPVGQSTRHQVQVGDTLSDIVSRIENRSMKLWPAVNLIFATNPDAFIDNDPNKLKAGSWLTIPSMNGSVPVVAEPAATETPVVDAPTPRTTVAEPRTATVDGAVYEPPILEGIGETGTAQAPVSDSSTALQPGDIVAVDSVSTIVIPDTELEGPTASSESPNVPTATIRAPEPAESTSIFAWLIGGGLAILALLVLFARRTRDRFDAPPVSAIAATSASFEQEPDDYDIDDDSPTEENLALDADLVLGTGLEEGTDMDIAQDFGFATPTEVDVELPFEPQAAEGDTDVYPPIASSMDSILESEVLPEDDDYEMSVIMDATKMPQPEDVTERDLQAIEVTSNELDAISGDYTINQDGEYNILEQDYQDELTATQALNQEIAKAAKNLADDLDEVDEQEETSQMPLATVTELDVTAQLPVQDEGDTIETARPVNPNDTAAVTIRMSADEPTAEMPVANDDETAEMEISGGKSG